MQTMPILTIESSTRLLEALEDFLDKSEANYALVIDRGGAILSQHGTIPEGTDSQIVAALAAGSFAAVHELATRVGEADIRALHQDGQHAQILMSAIDNDDVLVTVFGSQTTLGLVRFYSVRAVKVLEKILEDTRSNQREGPIFSESDLPGASSMFPR